VVVLFSFVLGLSLSFSAFCTTFQLQSLDKQVKEANGVIIGHFLKHQSVQLEDGSVATQMIFKMNKEYGLQSELFGMDEVIVHYPGGQIGDTITRVDGVPEFVVGERVVILIKSISNRYWGLNLGFGSFKVVNYGKESMMVNTLFPQDPKVGQIKLEDFEILIKSLKGSSLKIVHAPDYSLEVKPKAAGAEEDTTRVPASELIEGKNRAVASSIEPVENEKEQSRINPFWLVAVLGLLGGIFRLIRQNEY
jgi:hypothetical protein